MSAKIDVFVGAKFYKYKEDGSLETIRIVRAKSENNFIIIKDDDFSIKYTKTSDQLHEYTLLRSDALYTFNIVINAKDDAILHDILVTMSRKQDKNKPYVVCRQMMQNLFMQIIKTDVTTLGNCVSHDSCPPDVDFKINLICSKLVRTFSVNGYLNDTPEVIMKLASKIIIQSDRILEAQYNELHKRYNGLCTSVKELLEENSFWDEVNKGLKVTKLNDKIENCSLNAEQLTYLQQEISYLMDKVHVIEYDHDIDFNQIKSDYMLIRDIENKLYMISYLRGSFIKQEHLSEEELAKFNSIKI
jgi:hypothetical protein